MISPPSEIRPLYSSLATDPDFGEIVEMFVEEMPERVAALEQHLGNQNLEALRTTAHQIKGAAGGYGFDEITPYAAELEATLKSGASQDEIDTLCEALVGICNRVRAGTPESADI